MFGRYLLMTRKSIKHSFDELFEQRQLPSAHAKERMLNFQLKRQKRKIQFVPFLVTILFFIGISAATIGYISEHKLDHSGEEITFFNNTFSIEDGKFYLYGITHDDSKTKVIETLGDDYIEDTNVELGGSRYFDRLVYEKLGLTIIFNQDQVISITVKVNDPEEFERLYDSYNEGKYYYEGSTDPTSEQNVKHLYSEETLQIVTTKYDPYQTLWLTISYTSPEFISNLKAGIYE